MHTITVVEDDPLLNNALCRMLSDAGYHASGAHTLAEGIRLLRQMPDLLLLDIGLPDGEGIRLCEHIQNTGKIPVIFLTARDEEADMLRAFDCGADDYLVKPFPMAVLLKHVEAVLRRTSGDGSHRFCYGDLMINLDSKQVRISGDPVRLTPKEYRLLELLAQNQKRVVTKRMMLEQIWDEDGSFVEENTVNVTLSRLKKKIEPDPSNPIYIKNVFGLGYTLGE